MQPHQAKTKEKNIWEKILALPQRPQGHCCQHRSCGCEGRARSHAASGCNTERDACFPELQILLCLPQTQAELLAATLFPYPFHTKPQGIVACPCNSRRGGCTMLRARPICSTLHKPRGRQLLWVNPKSTTDPWLPMTAPLGSTARCQARVICHQTSDLLLCCVSPPPCSCPQSPIKSA